jgi:iron uptake system component EfeO
MLTMLTILNPNTRSRVIRSASVVTVGLLAACSVNAADSSAEVTGTDDACTITRDIIGAGKIEFDFTNTADDVSELYVLRANGDVVGEVENVTTGTSRTLTVDLVAGDYQIQCKPGQTGDGFTSSFVVTGQGGTPQAAPDREIDFDAVDFRYEDLDLNNIAVGTTIRFVMTNNGTQPHEFEILEPDGEAVGEVAAITPGDTGSATITFQTAGTYTFQCILIDPTSNKKHTMLGMTGTFEVPNN